MCAPPPATDSGVMSTATLASLAVLALIDATSFGTLLLPLWLLLAPGRPRPTRVLVFLGTVAAFYLALGIALVSGASLVADDLTGFLLTPTGVRLQFAVGAVMLAASLLWPSKRKPDEASAQHQDTQHQDTQHQGSKPRPPSRLLRWRDKAMTADGAGGAAGLVGLALAAATIEAASMLPYLAAIGMIGQADLTAPTRVLLLVAYCLVMILPALALLALRLGLGRRLETPLRRLAGWMERQSGETVWWIIGIVGFLIARDAVGNAPTFADVLPFG